MNKQQPIKRVSSIVATVVISMSELQEVNPSFTVDLTKDCNGAYTEYFLEILGSLGLDTKEPILEDLHGTHRNRFNRVVTCPKWSGEELTTDAWINSGYASNAAIDKASGSLLVESSYRQRGETKEIQESYDAKDKCSIIDESVWVKE